MLLLLIFSGFLREVWGVELVWLVMLLVAWKYQINTVLWWGFITGMIMAAAGGRGWGVYSLILMGIVLGVWVIRRFIYV